MLAALSPRETILLFLIVVAAIVLVGTLFVKGLKVAIILFIAFWMLSMAMFWIPDKLHEWTYTDKTVSDTMQDIKDGKEDESMHQAMRSESAYISDRYESWGTAITTLWQKISK